MLLSSSSQTTSLRPRAGPALTPVEPTWSGCWVLAPHKGRLSLCLPQAPPEPLHLCVPPAPFPPRATHTPTSASHLGQWQRRPSSCSTPTLRSHPSSLPSPRLPRFTRPRGRPVLAPRPPLPSVFTASTLVHASVVAWCALMAFCMVSLLPL